MSKTDPRIAKLVEAERLLGNAGSAEDRGYTEAADKLTAEARALRKAALDEFWSAGEDQFARWFPWLYREIRSGGTTLADAAGGHADLDAVTKRRRPPEPWESLAPDKQLALALERYDAPRVEEALAAGASADAQDRFGDPALIAALRLFSWRPEITAAILARKPNLRAKDRRGRTVLMAAAADGADEVVALALAAGADPAEAMDHGGTALMQAAYYGHPAVIRRLVAAGADVNQKAQDTISTQSSALHRAAENGQLEAVRALLELGADIGWRNGDGRTALDTARHWNRAPVIALLEQAR